MKRIVRALVLLVLLIPACIEDEGDPPISTSREVSVRGAPWTITMSPAWTISTEVFEPGPRDRVGIMTTAVANVNVHPDERAPGPNARGGASNEFGKNATIVLIRLLRDPNQKDRWNPRGPKLRRLGPSRWHDDAQNPGWSFRERKFCMGSRWLLGNCVSVLEWHGPDASQMDVDRMQSVASSIRVRPP